MLYITLLSIALFIANLVIERRNLWSGFTFGLASGSTFLYLLISMEMSEAFKNLFWLRTIIMIIVVAIAMTLLAGPLLLNLTLIYNGVKILRREGFSFRNMLSLGMGIIIPLYLIIFPIITKHIQPNSFLAIIEVYIGLVIFYLIAQASLYTVSSLINMINLPQKNIDYIIVLGAGLMETEVTPLLASRINKAIKLYRKQTSAKLIMSGGQGHDEVISEALAMNNYAIRQGIPKQDILLEDKATTTEENVRLSYALIPKPSKIAIVTNSYHIFRALLIARQEGVKCIGYGASSKFYFSLNAFIREFIAYLSISRKKHMIILLGLFILLMIGYVLSVLLVPIIQQNHLAAFISLNR